MIISIRGLCQLWGYGAPHDVTYYPTGLPFWKGGGAVIALGDGARICRWHWQRISIILFPSVLANSFFPVCKTDTGLPHSLMHLFICEVVCFIGCVWLFYVGFIGSNHSGTQHCGKNHKKGKEEEQFLSWANLQPPRPPPPSGNSPSLSFTPVSPLSANTWPMPRDVL